jgi:V/A-type H+-transporting ATPase subunit E
MKSLENSQDKIQKICDKIRRETIEPAKEESHIIIEEAKQKALEIKAEAEQHKEQLLKHARAQIEQERSVFTSSLQQATKQTLEALRQEIEQRLFNEELQTILDKQLSDPRVVADLINAITRAIEKEGLATDISAVIPRSVSADDISALLLDSVKKRLRDKPLLIGSFTGGVQVKLIGKRMTIDISDQALKEILANYVRKDFRQHIFGH